MCLIDLNLANVVCVGDSITSGLNYPLNGDYPSLLQRLINSEYPGTKGRESVKNSGVGGICIGRSPSKFVCNGNSVTFSSFNFASGKPILSMLDVASKLPSDIASGAIAPEHKLVDAHFDPEKFNIAIIWAGTNDFYFEILEKSYTNIGVFSSMFMMNDVELRNFAGTLVAPIYEKFVRYCAGRRDAGFYVISIDTLPRLFRIFLDETDPAKQPNPTACLNRNYLPWMVFQETKDITRAKLLNECLLQFNQLIQSNWKGFSDLHIDIRKELGRKELERDSPGSSLPRELTVPNAPATIPLPPVLPPLVSKTPLQDLWMPDGIHPTEVVNCDIAAIIFSYLKQARIRNLL
jgi:GDSL-like Lipase/Acylhydrolase